MSCRWATRCSVRGHGGQVPGPGSRGVDRVDDDLERGGPAEASGVSVQQESAECGDIAGAVPEYCRRESQAAGRAVQDAGGDRVGEYVVLGGCELARLTLCVSSICVARCRPLSRQEWLHILHLSRPNSIQALQVLHARIGPSCNDLRSPRGTYAWNSLQLFLSRRVDVHDQRAFVRTEVRYYATNIPEKPYRGTAKSEYRRSNRNGLHPVARRAAATSAIRRPPHVISILNAHDFPHRRIDVPAL